jgi:neutral trehalase
VIDVRREAPFEHSRFLGRAPRRRIPVWHVVFNSLLVQADRDLAEIASILGYNPEPFEAWALNTAAAIDARLWDDEAGHYVHRDPANGDPRPTSTASGAVPLYAAVPGPDRAERLARLVNAETYSHLHPEVMWMLCRGLERYGFTDRAEVIREHLVADAPGGGMLAAALALDLMTGR